MHLRDRVVELVLLHRSSSRLFEERRDSVNVHNGQKKGPPRKSVTLYWPRCVRSGKADEIVAEQTYRDEAYCTCGVYSERFGKLRCEFSKCFFPTRGRFLDLLMNQVDERCRPW